jgi:DNA-binding GntR family transcriptional regulator
MLRYFSPTWRFSSIQPDTYYIGGRQESLRDAEVEYRIHLLRLRADESQKVQLDSSYIPTPILEKRLTHSFRVSSSTSVKYGLGY